MRAMAPQPIFIHGAGGSSASWSHQEPRFEGSVVLSMPGHPAGTALTSAAANAEWVLSAIREVSGPRVLVGHSLGGAIAMEVALAAPEAVAGLVIIASGPRLFVPDAAFELAKNDFPAECERVLRKGYARIDDVELAIETEQMIANGQESLLRDYSACLAFDITDRLGEISVPVLVVAGEQDELTPPSLSEEIARGVRQSILVAVPETGHYLMKEHPATLDLLIAGFLARVELTE